MEIKYNQIIKVPQFEVDGCRQYGMNYNDIKNLFYKMTSETFLQNLAQLFVNYEDFITNIRAYPFEIERLYNNTESSSNYEDIPVGNVVNTGVTGLILKNPRPTILVNTFTIPRKHNSYLDYTPFTTYEIYLPFYGITELEINEHNIFNKLFSVYYTIDTYTGNALITITYKNDIDIGETDETIIKTLECKIGFDIPIGSTNLNEMVTNYTLGAIGAMVGGLGMMNASSSKGMYTNQNSMVTSAFNGISGLRNQGVTKGSIDDNRNMLALPQKVALIRKTPRIRNVTDFNFYYGKPLCQEYQLNQLTGYTEVGEIHLEDIDNATLTEIQEVEELLKSGVIL